LNKCFHKKNLKNKKAKYINENWSVNTLDEQESDTVSSNRSALFVCNMML